MVSPKGERVDMPIEGGYVGMVDRAEFDEFLRVRAAEAGAERVSGAYQRLTRDADGTVVVRYRPKGEAYETELRARFVIGADGALTEVGRQEIAGADRTPFVFAYHEIVETPPEAPGPLRNLLSRRAVARFLRLDFSARRDDERRRRLRAKGLFAQRLGRGSARRIRA